MSLSPPYLLYEVRETEEEKLPHQNQLVCKVTLLWQQMVDKLVLGKSLPRLPWLPELSCQHWIQHLRPSRSRQHLQNAVIKEKLSSWCLGPGLLPAALERFKLKTIPVFYFSEIITYDHVELALNGRQADSFSGCQFHWRYLSVISTARSVELTFSKQFANTSLRWTTMHFIF